MLSVGNFRSAVGGAARMADDLTNDPFYDAIIPGPYIYNAIDGAGEIHTKFRPANLPKLDLRTIRISDSLGCEPGGRQTSSDILRGFPMGGKSAPRLPKSDLAARDAAPDFLIETDAEAARLATAGAAFVGADGFNSRRHFGLPAKMKLMRLVTTGPSSATDVAYNLPKFSPEMARADIMAMASSDIPPGKLYDRSIRGHHYVTAYARNYALLDSVYQMAPLFRNYAHRCASMSKRRGDFSTTALCGAIRAGGRQATRRDWRRTKCEH